MKKWQPVLTGPLAQRARRVVDEIAAVLAPGSAHPGATFRVPWESQQPVDAAGETPQGHPDATGTAGGEPGTAPGTPEGSPGPGGIQPMLASPTLAGGTAGAALFFAYRAQTAAADADPGAGAAPSGIAGGDADAAAHYLDRSTEALASMPLTPDLYGGFAGVAWTAEHLYGPRFSALDGDPDAAQAAEPEAAEEPDGDAEDPLAEIDAALQRYVDRTPWTADYDLIRGLAGLGVYALERLPRPSALECLTKIVDRLAETAEHGPQGTITWHTSPELLPDWQRELFPKGYYNVGLAHGVPAVIAMLGATAAAAARIGAAGDPAAAQLAARARSLADGAVLWLLAQRLPAGQSSWFGATFSAETPARESRLAWCYGDPGIAGSLLVAAQATGDAALEKQARELALAAAARPVQGSGVRDAGLCHGSAGLGHLFNRLYQQTGDPRLAEASRLWFEQALDFQQPGLGIAGYRAFWIETDSMAESWRDEAGMLEGVAGIGLALLGGLGSFEPAWDRVMMLSAATGQPPRG